MAKAKTAEEKAAAKAAKAPKLAGASALNIVNRDGEVKRTFSEEQSDVNGDFVAKAEEYLAKENARGSDYHIEAVK